MLVTLQQRCPAAACRWMQRPLAAVRPVPILRHTGAWQSGILRGSGRHDFGLPQGTIPRFRAFSATYRACAVGKRPESTEQEQRPTQLEQVRGATAIGRDGNPSEVSFASRQHEPQKLSEDILTIPNVLTTLRLLSTPLLGWWVLEDEMTYALALLAVSGTTDVLDGYLARRYKSATVFGSIADPAADKVLMTVMVGALAYRGLIPLPLVILIIGRDVGLVFSAFIIRWRTLPEPKTISRYWDPRLPSAKVKPTQVSKYNTFLQIILVGVCTLLASMNDDWRVWWSSRQGLWSDESVMPAKSRIREDGAIERDWGDSAKKVWHAFMVVVAATTVWSGASYLSGSGAVRYAGRGARNSGQKNV